MEPTILYEDDYVLGINKPSGLMVHPDGKNQERTLADWIVERYPYLKEVGESMRLSNGEVIERPGIVHRIDKDTSGVLLVAKTNEAFVHLKKQFQDRSIEKRYLLFAYGVLPEKKGIIDRPIGKSKSDFRKWSAQRGARGVLRDAVTEYTVLEMRKDFSYAEARPKTGRTHQIRVHFKAIHHPIVCDSLYAPNHAPALGFTRVALHAHSISFENIKGRRVDIEAPLPEDFVRALKIFHTLPDIA